MPGILLVKTQEASKRLLAIINQNGGRSLYRYGYSKQTAALESLFKDLNSAEALKDLATIKLDVELEQQPTDLKIQEPDNASLLELYKDLEFKAWIAELADDVDPGQSNNAEITETHYDCITSEDAFNTWLSPDNFDEDGQQLTRLSDLTQPLLVNIG